MTILYLILFIILLALLGFAHYIHAKRTGNKLIESYQWYVKLLR